MALSLGIRLVIIFPTMLFLLGYILKGIIERKRREKILKKDKNYNEDYKERWNDFFFIFGIESIFLFIANGLILIFELERAEIGIITIIAGVVISMLSLVGGYADSKYSSTFGFLGMFGLLSGELAYFSSYGIEIMIGQFLLETILSVTGFIIGVVVAFGIGYLIYPK